MKLRRKHYFLLALIVLGAGYLFCLPRDLFKGASYSTVVTDRSGQLLGARIADDGQWRFPPCDSVPLRYEKALVTFEDKHFYWHPGVDPGALARALISNIKAGHVQSGGSTITMQVIRLSRNKERTLWQKTIEAVLATRLELRCTKKEILALYASNAPFGGNVVGIEAASWRYFGRPASELSWAESSTLAILPNAPSSIHPGKGREALLSKRNRLLKRLLEKATIDEDTYKDAIEEPLPDKPHPIPSLARQFVDGAPRGVRTRTGIDIHLQTQIEQLTTRWSDEWARNGIADLAAVVMDLRSNEIIAYVGNASPQRKRTGSEVDIAGRPRSTGSILKPFLFAQALQEGIILPETLLKDTPVNLGGFTPQNFDQQFGGAVPAREALSRSLNVPSVYLLREVGVARFHKLLQDYSLTTLTKEPDHYGLSLILGGGECRLKEITAAYATLARTYKGLEDGPIKDRLALWYTFDALKEVNRPDEMDWHLIHSVRKAAWKTGTSYGFRDAWAVGVTPDYAVGVWCGNADGSGMPGLVGAKTAGPVMFDILNLLPASSAWFEAPEPGEGVRADVCKLSGMLKGPFCDEWESIQLPEAALRSEACPYHKEINGESVFLLPPAMEWYYRQRHPEYVGVSGITDDSPMQFISPESGSVIWIPRQLDGSVQGIVFKLAHRRSSSTVWWHLDKDYVGETRFIHQLQLIPSPGKHNLTVVDEEGNVVSLPFTVAKK
ncbi:MAG: penicillin-binding protein 1C [Bacteroidales bacterium]|nr:penicillin-binding protein 1C [Bacteroidales bacterium]